MRSGGRRARALRISAELPLPVVKAALPVNMAAAAAAAAATEMPSRAATVTAAAPEAVVLAPYKQQVHFALPDSRCTSGCMHVLFNVACGRQTGWALVLSP